MHIDINQAINVMVGALAFAAALVRVFGKQDTAWGRLILKFGNDVLPHKPPPSGNDSIPPTKNTNGNQPSSSLKFVALASLALLVGGCVGSLQQTLATAQTVATIVQTILTGLRASADSYFATAKNPPPAGVRAHLDDLFADVSTADEAVQRLTLGHDKVTAGDIALAAAKLDAAYADLLGALREAGVIKTAPGAGKTGYVFAAGARAETPVPELPAIRGAS